MQLQFGLSSYQRGRGGLPDLPVVNLFAEEAPTEARGIILQSRPGLALRNVTLGAGPVKALFQKDGVLDEGLFAVSAGKLWNNGTSIGPVNGAGPWSLDGYENYLFAAGGSGLWGYDGSTLSAIAFPDDANVIKVIVANSRAIAIRGDTQKYYFSEALDTDFPALNFTSAESQPDRLQDAVFINGVLWLAGGETIEPHMATGSSTLPFQPILGRVINKGVKATGCMAVIGGDTFAYVSNENQVRLQSGQIISNAGMEERIESATTVRLFTFLLGGTEFLALRLTYVGGAGETQVYSLRSGLWSEFATYGRSNWAANCFAGGVFGSAYAGATLEWSDAHTDAQATESVLERRWRAGVPIDGGGVTINTLRVRCEVGQSPYLSGDYIEPTMEMRLSDDGGRTWDDWFPTDMGVQGNYAAEPEWRALGMASYPAFLCEFRVTDPVSCRVSDVRVNEQYGGR